MTTTVLLADDRAAARARLLAGTGEFHVVGEVGDGAAAITLARELAPDVVLLDLALPGMDGMSATRGIRGASPRTRVVAFMSGDDDALAFAAIEAGAQSFLRGDGAGAALPGALRDAARGEAVVPAFVARRILERAHRLPLTGRELDVLRRLAEGDDNVRIAATLGVREKTIKAHLGNVLAKLHRAG